MALTPSSWWPMACRALGQVFSAQVFVAVRQINQIRPAVGGDDDFGIGSVAADQPVAEFRMRAWRHGFVTVVRIDQRQAQRLRQVERDEAERQLAFRRVGKLIGTPPEKSDVALRITKPGPASPKSIALTPRVALMCQRGGGLA